MPQFLDKINYPADLKKIDVNDLGKLAEEIREFIISHVCKTGGHLAPSLGVVELTLILHYVFNAPQDKILWDVGHQAYVHKILTGRKENFHTLRQYGGISGFPKISESEYDCFGVGHSSTAFCAALGFAISRDLKNEHEKIITVVGDGAMTAGLSFEGLNNAGASKRDLIVVLNDNRMSISPNVGALSKYFTQIIANPLYNKIKEDIWWLTGKLPMGSNKVRKAVQRVDEGFKTMVVPGSLFERLGFRYFGPIDGHNIKELLRVFNDVSKLKGPILVHCLTQKGKGYKFAEEDATKYHGIGKFCPETGNVKSKKLPSYAEVFGKTVTEIAEKDDKIIGITAAMAEGTGLKYFAERFPERFFDVGIAEQHAVTFAAGLALNGYKPVVAIYSTFLQRALDQVIHDVALQNIPIIFALDRAGLVGNDGPTHHGSFDLSFLRFIPNLVVMSPKDGTEFRDMLWTACQYDKGPIAIRYPRGQCLGLGEKETGFNKIKIGESEIVRPGEQVAILAIGDRVMPAVKIAQRLSREQVSVSVINCRFIKPLDKKMIEKTAKKFPVLLTLENNSIIGGLGSSVAEIIAEKKLNNNLIFQRFGLPDTFITHGDTDTLLGEIGLEIDSLCEQIKKITSKFSLKNSILSKFNFGR
ncbi:MAG: 1-deoxy-D-xylulose-5-phosphate synthase [bacterium]